MFRMCYYFSLCGNSDLVHTGIFQCNCICGGGFVAWKPGYYSLIGTNRNSEYLSKNIAGKTLTL